MRIHGEKVAVRAKAHTLGGFSAHASQTDLLKWFSATAPSKPRVVLTHGESGPREALAAQIQQRFHLPSELPNAEDSILCDLFARHAVHAAMAGKTGLVIGYLHNQFIHVPIELLASREKRMDPKGFAWRAVLAATGQPERFE